MPSHPGCRPRRWSSTAASRSAGAARSRPTRRARTASRLTSLGSASLSLDGSTILRVRGDGLHGPPVDHDAFPPLPPLVPDEGPRIETVDVELMAGVPRAIEVEYAADSAEQNDQIGAQLRLGWEPPPGSIPPLVREAARTGCRVRRGSRRDADVRERDDGPAQPRPPEPAGPSHQGGGRGQPTDHRRPDEWRPRRDGRLGRVDPGAARGVVCGPGAGRRDRPRALRRRQSVGKASTDLSDR